MQSAFKLEKIKRQIRWNLAFFMIILCLSGLTAIPLKWELSILTKFFYTNSPIGNWFKETYYAIKNTSENYPYLFYGYDWLAFAHIIIAIAFVGPFKEPVKNKWVIEFGVVACLLVIPFALTAGFFRNIPLWWTLGDCSFGIIGLIPLGICYNKINMLEKEEQKNETKFMEYYHLFDQHKKNLL